MPSQREIIVMTIVASALSLAAAAQQVQVDKNNRTIAITTSDTARADADIAQVHIGFTAYAADEKTAYANAADISNAIIDSLTSSGVPRSNIESDEQTIGEQQVYQMERMPEAERQKHRFQVIQHWTVSTKAKEAAEVLNTAVNHGANNSGQIDWEVKDSDALQAEAAANALKHARAIAEQMARGLSATLGPLVYASNEAALSPMRRLMTLNTDSASIASTAMTKPLSISPRQVTKSATVYAVFALQ